MRSIWQSLRLVIAVVAIALVAWPVFAGQGEACSGDVTHRDYPWEGSDVKILMTALRALLGEPAVSVGFVKIKDVLGAPDRLFRVGNRTRAEWVFSSTRKFETLYCDGRIDTETQWEIAIIEARWLGDRMAECLVHRKSLLVQGAEPDVFSETSPLDKTATCENYLVTVSDTNSANSDSD